MQATIDIDEHLLERAREYLDITDPSEIVRQALIALIEREASLRMIALGGSDPTAKAGRRR